MALVLIDTDDAATLLLVDHYLHRFELQAFNVSLTTHRATFERWLGRPIRASYGGAYVYLKSSQRHAVLINLKRINHTRPRSVEIVVVEELLHMLDHVRGDNRRHARHGYDRIAHRVAAVMGIGIEEIRACLLPVRHRTPRYIYACPGCDARIPRRIRGTWSCRTCAPCFDPRYILRIIGDLSGVEESHGEDVTLRTVG